MKNPLPPSLESVASGNRWGQQMLPAGLILLFGLMLGVAGTALLMSRSTMMELREVRAGIGELNRDLALMAGLRDQWALASEVSTELKHTKRELDEARAALVTIRSLRDELKAEARETASARRSIELLAKMRNEIQSLGSGWESELAHLAVERRAVEQSRLARQELSREMALLRNAQRKMAGLNQLVAETVRQGMDVDVARRSLGQLSQMKSDIIRQSHDIEFARQRTDSILDVVRQLRNEGAELGSACDQMKRLGELTQRIDSSSHDLAAAVETLDLLTGFRVELGAEARKISGMKQTLSDVAIMAGMTERILESMEPAARRQVLSEQSSEEIRSAARGILERRKKEEGASESNLRPVSDSTSE
jgi:hypothetical protein